MLTFLDAAFICGMIPDDPARVNPFPDQPRTLTPYERAEYEADSINDAEACDELDPERL